MADNNDASLAHTMMTALKENYDLEFKDLAVVSWKAPKDSSWVSYKSVLKTNDKEQNMENIRRLIPVPNLEVIDFLCLHRKYPCHLAGSSALSLFLNGAVPCNDFDIWIGSFMERRQFDPQRAYQKKQSPYAATSPLVIFLVDLLKQFEKEWKIQVMKNNCITMKPIDSTTEAKPIDLVFTQFHQTMSSFDLSVCRIALNLKTYSFVANERDLEDICQKVCHYHPALDEDDGAMIKAVRAHLKDLCSGNWDVWFALDQDDIEDEFILKRRDITKKLRIPKYQDERGFKMLPYDPEKDNKDLYNWALSSYGYSLKNPAAVYNTCSTLDPEDDTKECELVFEAMAPFHRGFLLAKGIVEVLGSVVSSGQKRKKI